MPTYIALYRGINVVGCNLVKMDSLRALHKSLGHDNIQTYLQSGNCVFCTAGAPAQICDQISAAFAKKFPFTPALLIRTPREWARFIAQNPFKKFAAADPTKVHAAICQGAPDTGRISELLKKIGQRERFTIKPGIIYLHTPDGFGKSKFAGAIERAAGVPMTFRN